LNLDFSGNTRSNGTSSTSNTRLGWVSVSGVVAVEPEEVGRMVIPDRHDENDTLSEGLVNGRESTDISKVVGVTENGLLLSAEVIGDGVEGRRDSGDVDLGVLDDFAVLNIDTADFLKSTGISTVSGNELGNDSDLLGSVDGLSGSIEAGVTHAVRVEVASILVANTTITVRTVTALSTGATILTVDAAGVRSVGGGDRVGLPDIHFIAACSVLSGASIDIVGGGGPSKDVGLSVDKLDVVGALCIAVSGSVFGTSLVAGILGKTSIGIHFGEVKSTIDTAGHVGDVDVESELLVLDLEELVVGVVGGHEVYTGTNVGIGRLGYKLHGECIARSGDTVCATVVGTLESAVGGTCCGIGAKSRIPSVTSVTVGITRSRVEPAPVGVDHN
jgi:hypothetical protein